MGGARENVCARNIIDIFDYTAGIMHFNAPTLHSRVCVSLTHKITIIINLLLKFFNLEHTGYMPVHCSGSQIFGQAYDDGRRLRLSQTY